VRRLSIVWWSNTGGTARLVEAAARAARETCPGEVDVLDCRCDLMSARSLIRADALLVATPECLGTMAGPMKTFFDRCYYPAFGAMDGRPYAAIVCAGSDGHGAIRQIERIATGWRLRRVADPVLAITGAQTPEAILAPKSVGADDLARAAELGATLAAGLSAGLW
jgi:multimeric flavodoxin WrbA